MAAFMNLNRKVKYYKPRTSPQITDFKSLFRFEEENVTWLAHYFLGENEEMRGGALSPVHKLKVCLRYLADLGFQKGIGEELGVEQSTVSRTINSVINLIVDREDHWIRFPIHENEIMEAKQLWQNKFRFPTAIGSLPIEIFLKNGLSYCSKFINY
ncbi:hypothetical protein ABEB36_014311 [Hypothenemus hampei]|uniref:Transposase Helix-turn-helix domain-containing protein n=1 Tax=Hypothenemus hampei TaxID=57062 RepID=A0ABD1E409_HYPHA